MTLIVLKHRRMQSVHAKHVNLNHVMIQVSTPTLIKKAMLRSTAASARQIASRTARGESPIVHFIFLLCIVSAMSAFLASFSPSKMCHNNSSLFLSLHRNGEGCGYSGVNSMCYNDCLDNRSSSRAEVCAQTCRYIGAVCYDDCRNEGSTVARCLDDCGKNIDGNTGRAADRVDCAQDCADDNRVGSSGYKRCMDRNCSDDGDTRRGAVKNNVCEENCGDDFNKNSNKYDRCMDNCSDDTADQ